MDSSKSYTWKYYMTQDQFLLNKNMNVHVIYNTKKENNLMPFSLAVLSVVYFHKITLFSTKHNEALTLTTSWESLEDVREKASM